MLREDFIEKISISNWDKGSVLGRGSFGHVYLGVPNKPYLANVAIKSAPYQTACSLIREKVVLQKFIGCPEIVQYIGEALTVNTDDNIVYDLILEYAASGSLAHLIKTRGRLLEREVKVYLRMILQGLSCIHARGYVHCDLKPENILVFPIGDRKKMKLKIADFRLSERYFGKKLEESGKLKFRGTPKYMSPESLIGKIKPSLDIWSLGCVLVNMISGKCVWNDCTTREEVLLKLMFEMKTPNIPEELSFQGKDFLQKCFERNPKERWSADMLLNHPYLVEEEDSIEMLPIFIGLLTIMIIVAILF
ncbi:mitogen-activated protein kinase kinase kinase 17-like [Benincasa hispida]|uniref:mitogen-activated protein kinase kinase kinase 17-like n=1 Tax=Benincasa hispida TaxID=102211 RepID=UPI001900664E|nr:mitogen-activated protein kinase kinase kinase 17-like [Benincasa hispida]